MSKGTLNILNVGEGDLTIKFDTSNQGEVARAKRIVEEMLSQGFVILIEVGKDDDGDTIFKRVKKFDRKAGEYLVAGDPPAPKEKSARKSVQRIPAARTRGVAVGRTSGGGAYPTRFVKP